MTWQSHSEKHWKILRRKPQGKDFGKLRVLCIESPCLRQQKNQQQARHKVEMTAGVSQMNLSTLYNCLNKSCPTSSDIDFPDSQANSAFPCQFTDALGAEPCKRTCEPTRKGLKASDCKVQGRAAKWVWMLRICGMPLAFLTSQHLPRLSF